MKILYLDTETTGIDPKVNEIVQFAAIVEIDGEVKAEVNIRCQPTNWDVIDSKALETTGLTLEDLKGYQDPKIAAMQIRDLFNKFINKFDKNDKFYPAGHNVGFDLEFLQAFWRKHIDAYGTGSYQNWRALDSRVFGNFLAAAGKLTGVDMKLETICNQWNIPIIAHDALSDIRATREVIKRMVSML